MSSSVSFYGGWAGIAAVGAGYWYLQKRKPAPPVKQTKVITQKQTTKVTEVRKDAKPKKQRVEGAQSSGDQASEKASKKNSRKAKADSTPPVAANVVPEVTIVIDDDADEIDNREFARQLSNAKSGTTIGSRPQAGARQKSVKQSRANATKANVFDTSENAASGADADDDMSAADSPVLTATTPNNLGGVADMLEAASSGPSVIRITSPANAQPPKAKKQAKAAEPAETKKQRQNRQKKELEKAARDASEADRKVLQEAQRRTAREAEGRAAKDGSSFTARAPAVSSWTASDTAPSSAAVQLLDTYEPKPKPDVLKPKAAADDHYASLPSEEEQLRLIEEESAWNTVTKPKKGKKKADDAAAKPAVEAPAVVHSYAPEIKLPKKQTVEVSWADDNDHGVAKYDIYNDDWAVV